MFILTDNEGLSNGPSPYGVKGHGDVAVDHGAVPAGKVAHWQSTVPRVDPTYGNEGTGTWEFLDDRRKDYLYLTADGSQYSLDTEVEGQTYPGYGSLPAWLTTTEKPGNFYAWEDGAWVLNTAADLADAKTTQSAAMELAYDTAVAQDVSFTTAGGVTKAFQADKDSRDILDKTLNVCKNAGQIPEGFWWKSRDNTLVPFTLGDLVGLSEAMFDQGWTAFQTLAARKLAISSITTTRADVEKITWASGG